MLTDRERDMIQDKGERVRDVYIKYRQESRPSFHMSDKDFSNSDLWFRIGKQIYGTEITPEIHVRAAFDMFRPYPQINHLSGQARQRSLEYITKLAELAEHRFHLDMQQYRQNIARGLTPGQLADSEFHDFTPLFRLVIAYDSKDWERVKKLTGPARGFAEKNPAHLRVISDYLPPNWRDR